jgi:hypothetical protein
MATQERKTATDLGEQAIALAEQLGRIAGTIEGTAESWLQRRQLTDQLTRVRDGAAQMLDGLKAGADKGRAIVGRARADKNRAKKASAPEPRMAQPDPAHAPGKKRRKPAPTLKGVKKSDEKIPKMRTAAAVRQRRKSYA